MMCSPRQGSPRHLCAFPYPGGYDRILDGAQEIREVLFTHLDKSMTTPELYEFLAREILRAETR